MPNSNLPFLGLHEDEYPQSLRPLPAKPRRLEGTAAGAGSSSHPRRSRSRMFRLPGLGRLVRALRGSLVRSTRALEAAEERQLDLLNLYTSSSRTRGRPGP